jgi:hypothetical protein
MVRPLKYMLDKKYEDTTDLDLPSLPPNALEGLTATDAKKLASAGINTISDIASKSETELKTAGLTGKKMQRALAYAKDVMTHAETPGIQEGLMAFEELVDKAYEKTPTNELAALDIQAIQGLSKTNATKIKTAEIANTVEELSKKSTEDLKDTGFSDYHANKFVDYAVMIMKYASGDAEAPAPSEPAPEEPKPEEPAPEEPAPEQPAPEEPVEEIPESEDEWEKVKFVDKFDKDRAYEHVKTLAIPRMVGSEGETKAQSYITDEFKKAGLQPAQEDFEFTDFAWVVLIRLFEGIKAMLVVVALLLLMLPLGTVPTIGHLVGVCISVGLLAFTFYSSIWARFFFKYQTAEGKLFKVNKYKSKNIVATIPCAQGKDKAGTDVIVFANYDSKSQTFSALIRIILFYTALIVSIAFPIYYIGTYFLFLSTTVIINPTLVILVCIVLAIVIVVCTVLLEMNRTGNNSDGAINNATGIGVMLELAKIHANAPLDGVNITFIATGAGEMGLMGTVAFLKAHESEFDKEDTYFISLKDIANRGNLYIPGPVGFPPKLPCLEVEQLYKKALKRREIPIQEGSTKKIRVLSPWVFTGAWNDDMIAVLRGFKGNRVGIGGTMRRRPIIHTSKDTIDQVDLDAIDIIGKTTAEVLKRLDIRSRP